MGDLSPNFSRAEFACRCGCGADMVRPHLVEVLQQIRDQLGRPVVIRSGCRCAFHNGDQGGGPLSAHLTDRPGMLRRSGPVQICEAADLAAATPRERYELVRAALALGIVRIGIGPDFVHVDVDPETDQEILWLY